MGRKEFVEQCSYFRLPLASTSSLFFSAVAHHLRKIPETFTFDGSFRRTCHKVASDMA